MPSKLHSCSELQEGNKEALAVKREAETEEDLEKKIKDRVWTFVFRAFFPLNEWAERSFKRSLSS